uniref:Uncharacterized protein n=1 Tax=Kalanchoe fedtschenkoi TaxID=63787 RepID=A0A7N0TZH8_KALFE
MDISSFKLDIDELLDEFAQNGFTTLADMKQVWLSRKFSYIYEASPTTHMGLFMQSLYSHTLGRMIFGATLSHRLGGLYCLYCLYETQPFKPSYKIYLSLGDLKHLKNLTAEANKSGVKVVPHLIKRMLNNNLFLIGLVDINEVSTLERVNELTTLQNDQARIAYKKLFENTQIERFLDFDMGAELGLDEIKKSTTEYARAKKMAISEASRVVDVQNIEHIAGNKKLIGDVIEDINTEWKEQKELFHQQTGSNQLQTSQEEQYLPIEPAPEPEEQPQDEENEDEEFNQDVEFDQELHRLLSFP